MPLNGVVVGEIGAGCGDEIGICKSAGPAPDPGDEIDVGMPFGVETPARPPRSPPVPGKLMNEPPPEPGACPSSELATTGKRRARWCRPSVPGPSRGPVSIPNRDQEQQARKMNEPPRDLGAALLGRAASAVIPVFCINLGLRPTGCAPFQPITSLDSARPR